MCSFAQVKDPASVLLVPKALNTMSKSDKESLSQDMKEASKEQAEESYNMKKDSSDDKEEHSQERKKKKKEPQLPVSESSRSITFHSSRGSSHSDDVRLAVVANQLGQVEPDHNAEEGMVDGGGTSGYLMSKLEAKLTKALLGLRITAFVFCLISFSVLAGANKKGLFQFSFYNFRELKYCLSVNVIGFVYSGLQICDLVKYLITKKHIVNLKLLRFFSFGMDEILTYLLLSASTSAAIVARLLQASFIYADNFVEMANVSVALSFFAFKAFAVATLVSGYILCRFKG